MADLLLGVKIGTSGAPQTVKEIKAIDNQIQELQEQNKRVAESAEALGEAYQLSKKEVEQLTEELKRVENERAMEKLQQSAEVAADEVERLQSEISIIPNGLTAIAAASGAVGAGIGALFAKGIAAAADYDRTLFALQAQIDSTGGAVGLTAQELQKFASDLGNATLTSEEAVLRASRSLLSFRSVTGETFTRAITVAQDLAEVMGGDLESNIVQIGKALEDPVKGLSALSRSGTQFTEEQKKIIESLVATGDAAGAQNLILAELERQYGGVGIAAAAGLTGSLDTLGEELNDVTRAFGNFAQQGAKPVVDAAIVLVNTFNKLPGPIQTTLIATTAFTGVLASAIAAITAFNLANGKLVLTKTLETAATLKNTVATALNAGATTIAAAAKTSLALATGKATAAQIAQTKALAAGAVGVGVFAGAVASVALVADTFIKVDEAASQTREATKSVQDALIELGKAGKDTGSSIGEGMTEAQRNLEQLEEGVGRVQRSLDVLRSVISEIPKTVEDAVDSSIVELTRLVGGNEEVGRSVANVAKNVVGAVVPGAALIGGVMSNISTAVEAATNRSQIAFNELISATDDVRLAAAETAIALEQGVSIDPSVVQATIKSIDASISALKAQQPITEQDIALRDAQVKSFEEYRNRITETTSGVVALGMASEELKNKIKELSTELKDAIAGIDADALGAKARILEDLARGVITQEQAELRLANTERISQEDRLKALRENLNKIRELRAQAVPDSDEAKELDRQIVAAEAAIAQARIGIAQSVVDSAGKAKSALETLADANQKAMADLALSANQAKAAILERGGTEAEVSAAETAAIQSRIEANKQYLAQLQALGGQSAEDAKKTAEQIAKVEATLANDRVQLAQRVVDEKRKAEEKAERDRIAAIEKQAQLEVAALRIVADQRQAAFSAELDQRRNAIQVLQQQQQIAQSELRLEKEKLQTALAQAEAGENAVEAAKLRQQILEVNRRAIESEFEARREQLKLEIEIAQIENQRTIVLAEIAVKEAEIALAKAQTLNASEQEIKNLQDILRLRQDAAESARGAVAITEEIFELRKKQLGLEEDIAKENATQNELSEKNKKTTDKQTDNMQRQANLSRQIADAEDRRAKALISALSTQEKSARESKKELDRIRKRFKEAQQAGLFQGQGAEFEQATRQLEQILNRGGKLQDLIKFAKSTDSEIAKSLLEGIGRGDVLQLINADEQFKQPLVEGGAAAGNELEQGVVRGGQQAASLLAGALSGSGIAARKDGGSVQAGRPYLVGEKGPELITPSRSGWVHTAAQTASILGSVPGIPAGRILGSNKGIEARLDALLAAVQSRGPVVAPSSFTLNTQTPIQDAVAIQLQQIRGLARRGF